MHFLLKTLVFNNVFSVFKAYDDNSTQLICYVYVHTCINDQLNTNEL